MAHREIRVKSIGSVRHQCPSLGRLPIQHLPQHQPCRCSNRSTFYCLTLLFANQAARDTSQHGCRQCVPRRRLRHHPKTRRVDTHWHMMPGQLRPINRQGLWRLHINPTGRPRQPHRRRHNRRTQLSPLHHPARPEDLTLQHHRGKNRYQNKEAPRHAPNIPPATGHATPKCMYTYFFAKEVNDGELARPSQRRASTIPAL